jgi:MFS family permease
MNIVGGYLNDLFSKKYNLLAAIFLYSILSTVGLALSTSGGMIGFWRMIMAMGLSWGTTSILAILASLTGNHVRGTIYGMQKVFFWVGISTAGFIAPALLVWFDYKLIMIVLSIIGAFGLFLVFTYVKDPKILDQKDFPSLKKKAASIQLNHGKTKFEKEKTYKKEMFSLYIVGFIAKFTEDGIITTFVPLFILMEVGNGVDVGISVALYTILYAFFQPIGGWSSDQWGKWNLIGVGNGLILGGILFSLAISNETGLYMMVILTGMGSGILAATAEARASIVVSDKKKGMGIGVWRFFRDIGSFVGPIVAGGILSLNGSSVFLYFSSFLIFIALLDSLKNIFFRSYEVEMEN